MGRTVSSGRRLVGAIATLLIAAAGATALARAQAAIEGGSFGLTATVGGGHTSPKVLLRWSAADRPSPYTRFLIRRRAASSGAFVDLATVQPLTLAADVELVFPASSAIRSEAEALVVPSLGATLGEGLLALRASTDPTRAMQDRMLLNENYGAGIAAGLAHLDLTPLDDTRYLYEVWGLDAGGQPVERLGKVWALAGTDTALPAPMALTVVKVADEDNPPSGNFPGAEDVDLDGDGRFDSAFQGDGKVYLRWDPTPGQSVDRETQPSGFGFDVQRAPKGGGACPATPPPTGSVKVNRYPVVPEGTPDADIGDFFFVDDGTNPGASKPVKGTFYCYWAVARDLLGQHGSWSAPVEACAPDLGKPRQVFGVGTQVAGGQVVVSWRPNASEPMPAGGGEPYVDDTVSYNVYRYTDFGRLLLPPGAADRVATGLGPTITSWTDTTPAGPSSHVGRIYWYTVTALDAPVCGRPANESPHSAPARGVLYDMTPPVITTIQPYCSAPSNPGCLRDCGTSGGGNAWCLAGGTSGVWPLLGDDWGFKVPTGGTNGTDTFSVRLYRGYGTSNFEPVEEGFYSAADGGWLMRETALRSRVSQKLEYRLRAIDRDSNVGPVNQPRDAGGKPLMAFLRGDPPPRPTVMDSTPDMPGMIKVRWQAPGAEALAGFVIRVGPAERPLEGTFVHLPAGNLWVETSTDLPFLPRDTDGDGISPYDAVIRETTRYLAELPGMGGLDAGNGVLQATVRAPAGDEVVEVYGVDIAGQLGEAALLSSGRSAPGLRPDWPIREQHADFAVVGAFVDGGPTAPDRVDLCWSMGTEGRCAVTGGFCVDDGQCLGSHCDRTDSPASLAAIFRTTVEAGRPDSYQQRSPMLRIHSYSPSTCSCLAGLTNPVCWQDYGIASGRTYKYTVERIYAAPRAGERERHEGEIHSSGTPVQVAVP